MKWYLEYNSTVQQEITTEATVVEEILQSYKANLTTLIETIKSYKDNLNDVDSSIYWMLQDPIDEYKYKYHYNQSKLNNKQIDLFNWASISLL